MDTLVDVFLKHIFHITTAQLSKSVNFLWHNKLLTLYVDFMHNLIIVAIMSFIAKKNPR